MSQPAANDPGSTNAAGGLSTKVLAAIAGGSALGTIALLLLLGWSLGLLSQETGTGEAVAATVQEEHEEIPAEPEQAASREPAPQQTSLVMATGAAPGEHSQPQELPAESVDESDFRVPRQPRPGGLAQTLGVARQFVHMVRSKFVVATLQAAPAWPDAEGERRFREELGTLQQVYRRYGEVSRCYQSRYQWFERLKDELLEQLNERRLPPDKARDLQLLWLDITRNGEPCSVPTGLIDFAMASSELETSIDNVLARHITQFDVYLVKYGLQSFADYMVLVEQEHAKISLALQLLGKSRLRRVRDHHIELLEGTFTREEFHRRVGLPFGPPGPVLRAVAARLERMRRGEEVADPTADVALLDEVSSHTKYLEELRELFFRNPPKSVFAESYHDIRFRHQRMHRHRRGSRDLLGEEDPQVIIEAYQRRVVPETRRRRGPRGNEVPAITRSESVVDYSIRYLPPAEDSDIEAALAFVEFLQRIEVELRLD